MQFLGRYSSWILEEWNGKAIDLLLLVNVETSKKKICLAGEILQNMGVDWLFGLSLELELVGMLSWVI